MTVVSKYCGAVGVVRGWEGREYIPLVSRVNERASPLSPKLCECYWSRTLAKGTVSSCNCLMMDTGDFVDQDIPCAV